MTCLYGFLAVIFVGVLDELVMKAESRTAEFRSGVVSRESSPTTGTPPKPLGSSAVRPSHVGVGGASAKLPQVEAVVAVSSPWLTLSQADAYVRAPRKGTIADAVLDEELEAFRLPGSSDTLVHADDVDAWVRRHPYVPSGHTSRG